MSKEIIATYATREKHVVKVESRRYKKQLVELTEYARKFLKGSYNMDLHIPIELDGRLGSTMGVFHHVQRKVNGVAVSDTPRDIQLNSRFIQLALLDGERGWNNIIAVLKHELIHYALFSQGKPYNDGDATFEMELKMHGSSSTHTFAYRLTYRDTHGDEYKYNNWDNDFKQLIVSYSHI